MTNQYIIGLGGNIGDTRQALLRAIEELSNNNAIEIIAGASLYETKPWGLKDQPDFLNSAVLISSDLEPLQMLAICHGVEEQLERKRSVKWGPRTIDLDVLWWSGGVFSQENLTIPHASLTQRAFALAPLVELRPDIQIDGVLASKELQNLDLSDIKIIEGSDWYLREKHL